MCQKKNQNAFIIVSLVYGSADKKKKKKQTERNTHGEKQATCVPEKFGYVFETLTKKVF